jgi:hypothetical protein
MKKLLFSIGAFVVLVVIGSVVWYVITPPQATPTDSGAPTLPIVGNIPAVSTTESVVTTTGEPITTKSFIQDARPDPVNEGHYQLEPVGAPYLITYISGTQFFNIELIKEPLSESRVAAEQFLQATLGLSQAEMCKLQYQLSTPNSVSTFFGGKDLYFSFCLGAEVLP